jgi:hypothetical protein
MGWFNGVQAFLTAMQPTEANPGEDQWMAEHQLEQTQHVLESCLNQQIQDHFNQETGFSSLFGGHDTSASHHDSSFGGHFDPGSHHDAGGGHHDHSSVGFDGF